MATSGETEEYVVLRALGAKGGTRATGRVGESGLVDRVGGSASSVDGEQRCSSGDECGRAATGGWTGALWMIQATLNGISVEHCVQAEGDNAG
jgi:hypothetical protein